MIPCVCFDSTHTLLMCMHFDSTCALLTHARSFKFKKKVGQPFFIYIADELVALVLGSNWQTFWFWLHRPKHIHLFISLYFNDDSTYALGVHFKWNYTHLLYVHILNIFCLEIKLCFLYFFYLHICQNFKIDRFFIFSISSHWINYFENAKDSWPIRLRRS